MHSMCVHDVVMHDVAVHDVAVHDVGVPGMAMPSMDFYKRWTFFRGKKLIFDADFGKKTPIFPILCRWINFCRLKDGAWLKM
jgi:hypothetical protein